MVTLVDMFFRAVFQAPTHCSLRFSNNFQVACYAAKNVTFVEAIVMLLVEAGSMKWYKYVEFQHRLIGFDRVILKYSDYSFLKPIRMEESILFSMF